MSHIYYMTVLTHHVIRSTGMFFFAMYYLLSLDHVDL